MHEFQLSGSRRLILLFMGAGLLLMLCASLAQRITNPHLVVEAPSPRGMGAGQAGGGMNPDVGALMKRVSENPQDYNALIHLSEHLVEDKQWAAAETFVRRAVALAPGEAQPSYLLGVVLHSQGKHAEAAETLERVLRIKDEASVRYSLGVLYIHYLNNTPKGVEHLSAGLRDPKAPEALKAGIRKELETAPLPHGGGEKPKTD